MTKTAILRLNKGSVGYKKVRGRMVEYEGMPLTLTLLIVPRGREIRLPTPRILQLEDIMEEYFQNQVCLATHGRVEISRMFRGEFLSGIQRVHLFAHLLVGIVADLGVIKGDSVSLTDRLMKTRNRKHSITVVFDAALDENRLNIIQSIVWFRLVRALKGEDEFPAYGQMLADIKSLFGNCRSGPKTRPKSAA